MSVSPSRSSWGLLLAFASAVAFGTSGSLAASLIAIGWTPGAAVTLRIVLAALILTVPAVVQLRGRWVALGRSWLLVALYGLLAVAGAQLFYFNAIQRLPVGVALLLEYSGIILVVGWMWLRHAQRPRRLTVAGAALALAGLVLVLDLLGTHRIDPVGVLWGLAAAVGLAVYFVISASVGDPVPPLVLAWAGLCVGGIALITADALGILEFHLVRADVTLLGGRVSWLVPVLGLAVVAAAFAYVAGVAGARILGAKLSSFVGLTEVVAAVLIAWLLLAQVPEPIQLAGGVLVLAGVALVRWDEFRPPRDPQDAKAPASTLAS